MLECPLVTQSGHRASIETTADRGLRVNRPAPQLDPSCRSRG
jgi:hypothetical protein